MHFLSILFDITTIVTACIAVDGIVDSTRDDFLEIWLVFIVVIAFIYLVEWELTLAHEFDQVGLEDGLLGGILDDVEALILTGVAIAFRLIGLLDSEAIEHEHPLIDLELINVELTHELDNLDSLLNLLFVIVCIRLVLIFLIIVKHSHQFSL